MMQKSSRNSDAVSPVVGVMLMLVVTIIIAAVVSAFAGGVSQSASKTPQLTISAEARDNSFIIINDNGGDPVSAASITVRTFIPSGTFKDMSHEVDRTKVVYLQDSKPLYDYDPVTYSGRGWATIQTGDKIKINWADAFAASSYGGYMAPSVGEPVNIEIYDSASGKVIATAQASVLP